jgi:hypothetical protein
MTLGIMALDIVCPHAELPVHWLFMMLILLSLCRVFLWRIVIVGSVIFQNAICKVSFWWLPYWWVSVWHNVIMRIVIMVSITELNVTMPSIITMSFVMLSVIQLSVPVLSVTAPFKRHLKWSFIYLKLKCYFAWLTGHVQPNESFTESRKTGWNSRIFFHAIGFSLHKRPFGLSNLERPCRGLVPFYFCTEFKSCQVLAGALQIMLTCLESNHNWFIFTKKSN